MKNFYSIGQTAAITNLTTETLRHYDRIGLVKPGKRDEWTSYRFYCDDDIITLKTVTLLRCMDISLSDIINLLHQEDLSTIIASLLAIEEQAQEKIERLHNAVEGIRKARKSYEGITRSQAVTGDEQPYTKSLQARTLLVSEQCDTPNNANLWQYHHYFYDQIPESLQAEFIFGDNAAILGNFNSDDTFLVATCIKHPRSYKNLRVVPPGNYLCRTAPATELQQTLQVLKNDFLSLGVTLPSFYLAEIQIIGILKWQYEIQLLIQE